ncbi:Ltp family lipoprotein [Paraburkholderia sp. A1RI-2L]|uniref:Ltp family lipoprotein n=1 Tax=Paraburkholderia sp. A1RI-2L TaxID=3028367 RepID=UPI003B7A0846
MSIWGYLAIIALNFVVAAYASRKGRSKIVWFVISLIISPLLAAIVLFFMRPNGEAASQSQKSSKDLLAAGVVLTAVIFYFIGNGPSGRTSEPVAQQEASTSEAPAAATAAPAETLAVVSSPALAAGLTAPQSNAVRSAKQYLSMQGFSRRGLIHQLSSDAGEGYEVADATVAVDSLSVDWNEQAERSAKQYLSIQGFSCKGLIHQLSSSAGEGYTVPQATYGAKQAGAC